MTPKKLTLFDSSVGLKKSDKAQRTLWVNDGCTSSFNTNEVYDYVHYSTTCIIK